MGGRGGKYDTAGDIVGQYELSDITDSKNKIVQFYRNIEKAGTIRVDEETERIVVKKSAMQEARQLANELTERMSIVDHGARNDYQDLRRLLQGTYTISEQDRSNIPDFGAYAKSRDNFLRIGREGTSIDTVYQELSSSYPQYFDASRVTNQADQLQDINRVMATLKSGRIELPREYRQAAADDLRMAIIRGYVAQRNRRKRGA